MAAQTQCDNCGQVDDHPKLHYGPETYHHDCLPHRVLRDLTTEGYWQPILATTDAGDRVVVGNEWVEGADIPENDLPDGIKTALKIRELAESGTRGPKLLARIQKGI